MHDQWLSNADWLLEVLRATPGVTDVQLDGKVLCVTRTGIPPFNVWTEAEIQYKYLPCQEDGCPSNKKKKPPRP